MINRKQIGFIAAITPIWFLAVYLVMSSRRPEFSHLTKAVSELGSLDAPNLWAWNILGYIIPGLAVALLGVGVKREFSDSNRKILLPALAIVTSGLFMTLSGIFPGDFENRSSTTMILHTIGSLGSFVAFLFAGFWLPVFFRSQQNWRWVAFPSLALVIGSIVTGFLRSGEAPGLGQRFGFACYFLWVGLLGLALFRSNSRTNAA
jgi:hypothetical membrane protein